MTHVCRTRRGFGIRVCICAYFLCTRMSIRVYVCMLMNLCAYVFMCVLVARLLWSGEELYLQLDSHMRFVPGLPATRTWIVVALVS